MHIQPAVLLLCLWRAYKLNRKLNKSHFISPFWNCQCFFVQLKCIYDAVSQAPASYITLKLQAAVLWLVCVWHGGWVWMLWENNEQKLKLVPILEALLSPPYLHLSRLTAVYEREVSGSGLKSDTLVSKQLNSWGKWCQVQSKKARNGCGTQGLGSPAAAEMAELPVGGWNTTRQWRGRSAALGGADVAGAYADSDEWCNREGGDSPDFL